MFVPKPATYVQFENIPLITLSRVGGALAASRTFDITVALKNGGGEHQFSNINRAEQQHLEDFFKAKNIRFKNEMLEDVSDQATSVNLTNLMPDSPQLSYNKR